MEKEILTNSRLTSFRTCPKKHEIEYELGYRSVHEAEVLKFGKMVHKGIEVWSQSHDVEAAINAIYDMAEQTHEPDPYITVKAVALMHGYNDRYKDESYKVVAVEQEFRAPLLNPDTEVASRSFVLGGVLDGLVQHVVTGRYLIKEIKTTSSDIENETSDYWFNLFMDSQVSQYYIGAEALGYEISSCVYDVCRRPGMQPLKTTPEENRKYTKDGKLYAAQRDKDETVEEFYARVKADIISRPNYYFVRREVPRLKDDLIDFMYDAWGASRAILMFKKANRWPRNTRSCVSVYGSCPYFSVCSGRASLEDTTMYKKVETVHQELSTVTK